MDQIRANLRKIPGRFLVLRASLQNPWIYARQKLGDSVLIETWVLCEKDTQTVKKKKKERMMMMLQKRLVLFESVKKEQEEEEEEEEFDYSKLALGELHKTWLLHKTHPCEGVDKLCCNREELYRPLFLYASSSE